MRKYVNGLLSICLIALAAGCGDSEAADNVGAKQPAAAKKAAAPKKKVDVDLTKLNSMMVFAQVQNMMTEPKKFLGKTVRANGAYTMWCFSGTDECHHFVAVADAAACCQTGLEFQWKGARADDYPNELELIEVTGVFSSYEKFERKLYYLEVDGITVLKK